MQIHKDEFFPCFDSDRHQSVLRAIEVAHAFKLGDALQCAVSPITPSVIGAAEDASIAARLGDHCSRVVAANVVKSVQSLVSAAHNHDRLTADFGRDEVSGVFKLREATDHLPGSTKNILPL